MLVCAHQSAPASISGNVCRIWKATADGRVCRAACASMEMYQSLPNIFSDILDMKGIMQTPVTNTDYALKTVTNATLMRATQGFCLLSPAVNAPLNLT